MQTPPMMEQLAAAMNVQIWPTVPARKDKKNVIVEFRKELTHPDPDTEK